MWKQLTSLVVVCSLLFGCQEAEAVPNGFYEYDKDEVKAAVDELSFNPEMPEFIPIDVDFLVSDRFFTLDTGNEALDVSFYTRENDLLQVQFVDGELGQTLVESEKVIINNDVIGDYVETSFAQVLSWQKQGITYKLTYRSKPESDNPVSKSQLIEVAKSFQS